MSQPLLFAGGPIQGHPAGTEVLVSGGVIQAVGSRLGVSGARRMDLDGRMLCPGFQDAHVHPITGGLRMLHLDLSDLDDVHQALATIGSHVARGEWVQGGGWAFDWFERGCPSARLLDKLAGDRPAYLVVRDGHSAWVNTTALRMAGIDRETPDPVDGRIERLPDGTPQGTLHEGAMRMVERLIPAPSPADLDAAFDLGQRRLISRGITGWQDASVTAEYHAAYLRAVTDGRLVATVRGALWWERERDLEQIEELVARWAEAVGKYRPGAVKLMLDGVVENFTASVIEPYTGQENRGIDFIDPDTLRQIVIRLDRLGFQCHFHTLGDRAVRSALDAVEAAHRVNPPSDLRHHLAHLQLVDPSDQRRFHRLGVVANCQPLWACNDPAMTELTLPHLGDRWVHQYPFGSLAGAGARLAMGSDWPVTTDDVMAQISVAVTRLPVGRPDVAVLLPEERLGLGQALEAFTAGSAFVNHDDERTGSIEVGKAADLVVLSGDPFAVDDLASVVADLTIIDGEVVYERG